MNTTICKASLQIGSILMALENFKELKHHVKFYERNFKEELAEAKKNYEALGIYEDCGSYYQEKVRYVEGTYLMLISKFRKQMIRKEKYYRKLRHQFLIDFPAHSQILEQMTIQKNSEIADYHRNKKQY